MFKLTFSKKVQKQLEYFIDALTDNVVDRFSDTGIDTIDIIVERYIQSFDTLYISIRDELQNTLTQEIILGRKQSTQQQNFYTVILRVKNYILIVDYKENSAQRERTVTNLQISYSF